MMNDNETIIHTSIKNIRNIMPSCIDSVQDNEQIRSYIDGLTEQLFKIVGKRIIRESIKNGQTSTS